MGIEALAAAGSTCTVRVPADGPRAAWERLRTEVPYLDADRILHEDLEELPNWARGSSLPQRKTRRFARLGADTRTARASGPAQRGSLLSQVPSPGPSSRSPMTLAEIIRQGLPASLPNAPAVDPDIPRAPAVL